MTTNKHTSNELLNTYSVLATTPPSQHIDEMANIAQSREALFPASCWPGMSMEFYRENNGWDCLVTWITQRSPNNCILGTWSVSSVTIDCSRIVIMAIANNWKQPGLLRVNPLTEATKAGGSLIPRHNLGAQGEMFDCVEIWTEDSFKSASFRECLTSLRP